MERAHRAESANAARGGDRAGRPAGWRLGALLLAAGLAGTGCTAVRGDKQKVSFVGTEPKAVELMVTGGGKDGGGGRYVTPVDLRLARKDKYIVTAWADGYQPLSFEFEARVDTAAALPFLLPGGSVMLAADAVSGANKDFSKAVTITLNPAASISGATAGGGVGKSWVPTTQPVLLKEWRGKLYTPEAFDAQIRAELAAIRERTPMNAKRPVKGF